MQLSQYLIFSSTARRDEVKDFVDKMVVRNAWLSSKSNFINSLSLNCRKDYVAYEQWWFRRFHLHNYIRSRYNHKLMMFPEDEEFHPHREEMKQAPDPKVYHRQKIDEVEEWNEYNKDDEQDLLHLMFETDLDIRAAYMNELELIIQFQLAIT